MGSVAPTGLGSVGLNTQGLRPGLEECRAYGAERESRERKMF